MPIGHVVLKIYVPCKNFHMSSQYLYKSCKAYAYCWKNKYMPWLKIHLPFQACKYKSLCALRQDLHAPGMWAHLNIEPCEWVISSVNGFSPFWLAVFARTTADQLWIGPIERNFSGIWIKTWIFCQENVRCAKMSNLFRPRCVEWIPSNL